MYARVRVGGEGAVLHCAYPLRTLSVSDASRDGNGGLSLPLETPTEENNLGL